jgi:cytochrome c oxidase assembly protein subunit 15
VTVAAASEPAAAARDRSRDRRAIRIWLYSIAILVLAMVVVGGATRLTESGLSITEWEPIHGVIPPLNDTQWQDEFAKYQLIPEFQELRPDMTLSEFKGIFWWEWGHRLLGRLIGFAFAIPFLWFWFTGRIERSLWPRLIGIFILGGIQGGIGWWMVASGLSDRTDVSQYRLAIHLVTASLIFAYTIWVARGLRPARPAEQYPPPGIRRFANVLIVLVFLQLYFGALVAGLNAGFSYNDWPTMGDTFVPSTVFEQTPWWRNFFENIVTVQFQHRMLAYLIAILIAVHAFILARRMPASRTAFSSYRLVAIVAVQILLGVLTLVNVVPLDLALTHQFVAFVLLAGVLIHRRGMTEPIPIRS